MANKAEATQVFQAKEKVWTKGWKEESTPQIQGIATPDSAWPNHTLNKRPSYAKR